MNLKVSCALIETDEQFNTLFNEGFISNTNNFFLSKSWIYTWFKQLTTAPLLVQVRNNNQQLVGAAFFNNKPTKNLLLASRQQFSINATRNVALDQIWIEYNDCYFLAEYENAVKMAIVNFLYTELAADEIIIGTSTDKQLKGWENPTSLVHKLFETKGYIVDFKKIRQQHRTYKDCLSKNTRYQINRSIKGYESKFGPLKLHIAKTPDEALNFFEDSADWHQQRWTSTPEGSGFDNPHFVNFHAAIIKSAFVKNEIKYLKVTAANHVLGYLYCFSFQNKIYFYLSSINYEMSDNKLKPGIVMHYLAIQHFEELGFDSYDFLGGEARYKQSLSTDVYELAMVSFNKASYSNKLKTLARRLKNMYKNQFRSV